MNSDSSSEEILYDYDPCSSVSNTIKPTSIFREYILMGDTENISKYVREKGPEIINNSNEMGYTSLHSAVVHNQFKSVRHLLTYDNLRVNATDYAGNTPLLLAVIHDIDSNIIETLVKNGADVNLPNLDSRTPLQAAVAKRSLIVPTLLIAYGADVNVCDSFGNVPLDIAVISESVENVALLLLNNCDVYRRHFTRMYEIYTLASCSSNKHIFDKILRRARREGLNVWKIYHNMLISGRVSSLQTFERIFSTNGIKNLIVNSNDKESLECFLAIYLHVIAEMDESTRLKHLYLLLSYDVPLSYKAVETMYINYGYSNELVAVLQTGTKPIDGHLYHSKVDGSPLPCDKFLQCILYDKRSTKFACPDNRGVWYKFYADEKQPPSLIQLSRDVIRARLYKRSNRSTSFTVYNAVQSIDISKTFKDILLLKTPLYLKR